MHDPFIWEKERREMSKQWCHWGVKEEDEKRVTGTVSAFILMFAFVWILGHAKGPIMHYGPTSQFYRLTRCQPPLASCCSPTISSACNNWTGWGFTTTPGIFKAGGRKSWTRKRFICSTWVRFYTHTLTHILFCRNYSYNNGFNLVALKALFLLKEKHTKWWFVLNKCFSFLQMLLLRISHTTQEGTTL